MGIINQICVRMTKYSIMKPYLSFLFLCLLCMVAHTNLYAACTTGQATIVITIKTDNYPSETGWSVTNAAGTTTYASRAQGYYTAQNTIYTQEVCVPANTCVKFTITDQYGDGVCCGYGNGYYTLTYNGTQVANGGQFNSSESTDMGCPVGTTCASASVVTLATNQQSTATFTAVNPDKWFKFTPDSTGQYKISTCFLGNSCNTKLYLYDHCTGLIYDEGLTGSIAYSDDACDVMHAQITAALIKNNIYYIRVGDVSNNCSAATVNWSISFDGPYTGCTDPTSCTYNPLATVSDPAACFYYPSPQCPTGPDLTISESTLRTSLYAVNSYSSTSSCNVREGCLKGYGTRQLVRFTTRIDNIGQTDFYAGIPPSDPNDTTSIYEYDLCHGHWHFEDYAEYLLVPMGQDQPLPVGYKNGFCVLDLICNNPKYTCGNMGITAGCADEYSSSLSCQWVDVTNIPAGDYKLIVRVNWAVRPDLNGRYEVSYDNNWGVACFRLARSGTNQISITTLTNCTPFVDCAGTTNGLAQRDCEGTCSGTRITGDINQDNARNTADVTAFMTAAVANTTATNCIDLNRDGKIDVADATLMKACNFYGPNGIPTGLTHEPCYFPSTITNTTQTANVGISNHDVTNRYVDIAVKNPNFAIVALQMTLTGIQIESVESLVTSCFNDMISFNAATGKVAIMSTNGTSLSATTNYRNVIRVHYTAATATDVCFASPVVVNSAYEPVKALAGN
jgi:hypothetical protein